MTIEVGQTLDKYELLEEVGQGGMAVVYRGMDTSLHREVAVKVLHKHLSGHKEARDRFEREAQAVAKLRHENILEIFDFSRNESAESYIVTEFIDGETLRQFVSRHDIKYPEVGALITAQVCKALNHAHGLGILHRDVKPENIMVRRDGVVKLTDFGIAQMVDLQRMTVTGQLLGSPAYMSPEHVEGRPLDFRTDVFSVGILLYQLVTGALPFTGRNPHELLKRIAECRFKPPVQLNPRVGRELDKIVRRAMAREPADRFADISEMLSALTRYLAESGLEAHGDELARFFSSPTSYELAFETRLVDTLTRRGRALVANNRVAALEMFNRVLTLQPENADVLGEIDRMGRQRRSGRLVLLVGGVLVLGGVLYVARSVLTSSTNAQQSAEGANILAGQHDAGGGRFSASNQDASVNVTSENQASPGARDAATQQRVVDAAPNALVATSAADAAPRSRRADARRRRSIINRRRPDAAVDTPPPIPKSRPYKLVVYPPNSEYRVGGGPWTKIAGRRANFEARTDISTIEVRNEHCCQSQKKRIAESPGGRVNVTLGWLPARLTLKCSTAHARAQIDGKARPLAKPNDIPIGNSTFGERTVEVAFFTDDGSKFDKRTVRLRYRESKVVTCAFK